MPRGSRRVEFSGVHLMPADWFPEDRGGSVMPTPSSVVSAVEGFVVSAFEEYQPANAYAFASRADGKPADRVTSVSSWRVSGSGEPWLFISVTLSWTGRSPLVVRIGRRVRGHDVVMWHPEALIRWRFGSNFSRRLALLQADAATFKRLGAQWSWLVDADAEGVYRDPLTPAAAAFYAIGLTSTLKTNGSRVLFDVSSSIASIAASGRPIRARDVILLVLRGIAVSHSTRSAAHDASCAFLERAVRCNAGGILEDLPSLTPAPLMAGVEVPRSPIGGESTASTEPAAT